MSPLKFAKPRKKKPRPRRFGSSLPVGEKRLKQGGRVKPKKRSADEAERIYGPREFRDWLHGQPCAVCGFNGRSEQAHAKGGGVARKADWTETFPACGPHFTRGTLTDLGNLVCAQFAEVEGCHREMHRVGVRTFEKAHRVKLADLAAQTQAAWQSHVAVHPERK